MLLAEGRQQWDILILDLSLPRVSGLEVLRRLRSEVPELRVIVLSMYPEDQYALRLLNEGAAAYLSKEHPPEELLSVLRQVARGQTYLNPALSKQLLRGARDSGQPLRRTSQSVVAGRTRNASSVPGPESLSQLGT